MTAPLIPGHEGSIGPGPAQYHLPHVYARNIHSGSGNCVCGRDLGDKRHTEAAPGVPIPPHRRRARDICPDCYSTGIINHGKVEAGQALLGADEYVMARIIRLS